MSINHSQSEIVKNPIDPPSDSELYLWLILGCSVAVFVLLTALVAVYLRRRFRLRKADPAQPFIPGCPSHMMSSFSSSTSEDGGESAAEGRQFRRPLGPSASLDPPALLRMTQCAAVQPRPQLPRWHTVAGPPHCRAIPATLDNADRDSDEENILHPPPSLHGRLWFSLQHNEVRSTLDITLIKAKYLPGRGLVSSPRDPFVKVFLLPDEENYRQSQIRRRTLSPKFNETFQFSVVDVRARSLKLSVYDVDKRKVRHCLGHVILSLDKAQMKGNVVWKDLEIASQASSAVGEMEIQLSCNPHSNRIKAAVCKLRNLNYIKNEVSYVRVQLYHGRKAVKCKRSVPQSVEGGCLSVDETFSFAIAGKFFDSCSLHFALMLAARTSAAPDIPVGQVVIGPFMYARGEQLQHWQEMLSNPRTQVLRWHAMEPPPTPRHHNT